MNGFTRSHLALLLALGLGLSGCALRAPMTSEPLPESEHEAVTGSFAPETLFDLMLAEIAGQREQYGLALAKYLKQAGTTRDIAVIQRCLQIAQYVGERPAALTCARLWREAAPDDAQAHEALALELARSGLLEQATRSMQRAFELGGEARFGMIAGQAQQLSLEERQRLLTLYNQLLQQYPEQPNLLLGKALLLQQNQQLDAALELLAEVADLSPDNPHIPQLQARLLHEAERDQEAAELLADALDRFPDAVQLRLLYARMLVSLNRMPQAQEEFERLLESDPDDPELLLSVGLVALENGQSELARSYLERLIEQDANNTTAYYYLGQLAEQRGASEEAIDYYRKVEQGQEWLPALAQRAQLLMQQGRQSEARTVLEQARATHPQRAGSLYLLEAELLLEHDQPDATAALLRQALKRFPDHTQLLYLRAMLAQKQGRLDDLERDLRRVLAQEPNNAAALNALGYTLADQTERLDEARQLIEQAYRLTPNDPAVIDSMAWVLYRQGDYPRALELLAHAYGLMPDHEIAAHYGELLWVTGQPAEAKAIWREALESQPDSDVLRQTLQRFLGQTEF